MHVAAYAIKNISLHKLLQTLLAKQRNFARLCNDGQDHCSATPDKGYRPEDPYFPLIFVTKNELGDARFTHSVDNWAASRFSDQYNDGAVGAMNRSVDLLAYGESSEWQDLCTLNKFIKYLVGSNSKQN